MIAICDFRKGDVSVDQLASIGDILFQSLVKLKNPQEDSELFDAVLAASELSFYVRRPKFINQFGIFLKEVFEFERKFK